MNQEEKRLIQNKYEIVSKIKQGGFGIVYKGYDHVFEKPVAIKAVEPGLLREAKYIDLFLEEAKNAGKLSHNNIVHIYNLVRDENGQFFIIMEYVDGVDLGKLLRICRKKNITIPLELSIFVVKEICKALEYAHNKRDLMTDKPLRLVHQDISPSNIMTSLAGQVKLIDFGLAKIRFQRNNANETVLSGKLPYMAPEQLNGGIIDRRTDIFSLGTVFYEMLTGKRLFPLDDPDQTVELIKKCRIDPGELNRNRVPESVQKIVLKMLQRDPESRYQGANGVYLDLVECLMTMGSSVELAEALGKFMHDLIETDGSADEAVSAVMAADDIGDEVKPSRKVLTRPETIPGGGAVHSRPAAEKFEIKDPTFDANILQEKMRASLTGVENDNEQAKKMESAVEEITEPQEAEPALDSSPGDASRKTSETGVDHETDEPGKTFDLRTAFSPELPSADDSSPTPVGEFQSILDTENKGLALSAPEQETAADLDKIFDQQEKIGSPNVISQSDGLPGDGIDSDNHAPKTQVIHSGLAEEEGEDDLKTVIDVIRLSTKRHKKVLKIGGASLLGALLLFMLLDIMLQITAQGEGIYNRLFPPAIRISSLPVGASVYIDNKPVKGKTPLSIPKISPGVHELKLTFPGFNPLIKSIHVPSKGEVKVTGEKTRKGYDPYLFRFKSQVNLSSDPGGATIYLNQLLYPQKTPATIEWEAGTPLSIEMEQANFQKLSGFTLNTVDGVEEIEDRRLWSFHVIEGEAKSYVVEGIFKKFIVISCIPSGVNFYVDGSPTPSGRTDVTSTIALTMGKHEVLFQKPGFNSRTISLNVNKNGPESISVMLTRNIRFFAKDKNDPGNNEIGARIVRIIQNNKSYPRDDRTPCELSLPPVNLQVVLAKEGYKEAIVNVSPRDNDVVVKMEPAITDVEIIVSDALTNLPLRDAQISYRSLSNDQAGEVYYGATDEHGRCVNRLAPGEYSFKVKKFGYFEKYANLNTKSGNRKLEFKLIIQ